MSRAAAPPFLRSVVIDWDSIPTKDRYPFDLPCIRSLDSLPLHPAVTYFVGENGAGKSTLLEAIAIALGLNPEGGTRGFRHASRHSHSELYRHLTLRRGRNPRDAFFLRAESFYNLATEIEELDSVEERERIRFMERVPKIRDSFGGRSLHEQSHGESFLALFLHRLGGDAVYLLDEPESALSPARQMAFLSRAHQLVAAGSQLIIATHSPIVLAYPDATIYEFGPEGIRSVAFEETEPYVLTKRFLNDRERMLERLLGED